MPSLPLTHASEIRTLSAGMAKRKLPVDLHGAITYVDSGSGDGQLFIQDKTAGIFVFQRGAIINAPLRAGQFVEVRGVTTAGDFSPCIAQARITVLHEGAFPTPKRPAFDQFPRNARRRPVDGTAWSCAVRRNQGRPAFPERGDARRQFSGDRTALPGRLESGVGGFRSHADGGPRAYPE